LQISRDTQGPSLGSCAVEFPVPAELFPGVDVGGDRQQIDQCLPADLGASLQLWGEYRLNQVPVHVPTEVGDPPGVFVPVLLSEESQRRVAALLVVPEDHLNRGVQVADRCCPLGDDLGAGERVRQNRGVPSMARPAIEVKG